MEEFIRGLPKVELHLHIEGTLEPEMMFGLAERNGLTLPFASVEEVRAAYEFTDLQSFLDIYYQGAAVLQTEQDFYDLMWAYLDRMAGENLRHAEIFFDPQTHTERGIGFETLMAGFERARADALEHHGITTMLIMCFLRHLSGEDAVATFEQSRPFLGRIDAVGLDSGEVGNPPERFAEAYRLAREAGLRAVAHAGEEGPPAYIWGALDVLGAERIDHGVACEHDEALLERLADEQIPLTMCPLSNVKLRVFDVLEDHNLKRLLDRGVRVMINSDDPAYFGGYLTDNYLAVQRALGLGRSDLVALARNGILATFLSEQRKADLLGELDGYATRL
jgi:adenosine deaminase